MAQSPRKPSSNRPAAPEPAADLFAAAPQGNAEAVPEEWNLEEGPTPLPKGDSLPKAAPVRVAPISSPKSASFESNPDAAAEAIPQALPRQPASPAPAPQPVAESPDPFEIDDDLPAIAPSIIPSRPEPSAAPAEGLAEAATEEGDSVPVSEIPPRVNWSPTGLLVALGLLGAVLALFFGIIYANRPAGEIRTARPSPTVPLTGKVATLSAIQSGWRTRQPGDLISTVDIVLPSPSRQQPDLVPEVRITIDPAATKTGFLRFIFFDPDGKISGDVRVLKVNGSTIEPLSSGAKVTAPGSAAVYGSLGFMDRANYVAYATSSSPRWFVEISESTVYNAKEDGWTKLDTFDLRNAGEP